MYFETTLLISLIVTYYVAHGRKFLSLDRIAEPLFIVNVLYLLNFPVRAAARMFLGAALESAPALIWNIDECNVALLYSTACMLVFNFSYEYFSRRGAPRVTPTATELKPMSLISVPMMRYLALLGMVVIYFRLTSETNIGFIQNVAESDIPQVVNAIQFAIDASVIGSLIMFLHTRRLVYLVVFVLFYGAVMYIAFMQTAKYAFIAYFVIFLLIAKRFGFKIQFRYLVLFGLMVVPYTISSYLIRDFDLAMVSSDVTLVERLTLLRDLVLPLTLWDTFVDMFLLKMTDRFVYLETFMLYLHAINHDIALDLYDMLGSLPTYTIAIPSIFGVDKSTVENIHVWYANKYWYGSLSGSYGVVIPFGRIVESFMIFRWLGCLFFIFYGWLFSMLYRKLYCSTNPLLVIYYCFLFYDYVLADDVLLFHLSAIIYGTIFLFGSIWAFKMLRLRQIAT